MSVVIYNVPRCMDCNRQISHEEWFTFFYVERVIGRAKFRCGCKLSPTLKIPCRFISIEPWPEVLDRLSTIHEVPLVVGAGTGASA